MDEFKAIAKLLAAIKAGEGFVKVSHPKKPCA